MNTPIHDVRRIPFIRELCKHKNEAEIQEAEANFRKYLKLVSEICDSGTDQDMLDKEEL